MSEPTFSVVMAAYRTSATIGAAIRSVLAQSRSDFELIVIDDGSGDATADRARAFESDARVRVLHQGNAGAAAARATGIAAATGHFLSLIDSDDLWMPGYLAAMGEALESEPGVALAYTDAWFLHERTRRVRRRSAMAYQRPPEPPPRSAEELFEALLERNFIYNAVTLRREVIEEVGPPDARLRSSVDWEWWLRIAALGHRAVRVPGRLAIYRPRRESLTGDRARVAEGRRDLWRLLADEYDLPLETRALLRARARRAEHELAALSGRRSLPALRANARHLLGLTRTALVEPRHFHREPPPEVRSAFPDLRAV